MSINTVNKKHGTQDWADITVNCCTGCSHDCVYCYAKGMAYRFGQVQPGQWPTEKIRPADVARKHSRYPDTVMFPSSHDITPNNLSACLQVLDHLLVRREVRKRNGVVKVMGGNEVLIVSKPHLDCIQVICQRFTAYREQILFRFTIGACDDSVLSSWEPGAPSYGERKASLRYAQESGFETSVSVEPLLDPANIDQLIAELIPYVSETIWIGKMNHLKRLVKGAPAQLVSAINHIKTHQADHIIKAIYQRHKDNPKIRWKDSVRKVLGVKWIP